MKPSELPDIGGAPTAVDCETSGLFTDDGCRVASVGIAWLDEDGEMVSYGFPFAQGPQGKPEGKQGSLLEVDHNLPESEWVALLDWLDRRRLLNQNVKFDAHHLRVGTYWGWPGRDLIDRFFWDTSLGTKELDPVSENGLKQTALRRGLTDDQSEQDAMKEWLKKNRHPAHRYDLVPWEICEPYVVKDAEMAVALAYDQWARIDAGESSYRVVDREFEVMYSLYRMEERGMDFDVETCLEAAGVLEREQEKAAKVLPFVPSVNEAKRFFFSNDPGCLGLPPYDVTPKKQEPKLDDEIVTKMVKDKRPHAAEYQRWRKMDYALSMWYRGYPAMIGTDGRLRTSFRQTKVVSGRFSVERIQLQAIPHDHRLAGIPEGVPTIRSMFRAKEGHQLWELDLSQAELRVAAKFARCDKMMEMFLSGDDIHGYVTEELFDVHPGEGEWFKFRQVGKRADFSFIFGVGAPTFQATVRKLLGIEFSMSESERIVQHWRAMFPEFMSAVYREDRLAGERRWVSLANGKRRWFMPHEHTHKAFNQKVQSSLSEMNKDWLVATEAHCPGSLVMSVHDSVVLELPVDDQTTAYEVAEIGGRIGTEMFGLPMSVDVGKWGEK